MQRLRSGCHAQQRLGTKCTKCSPRLKGVVPACTQSGGRIQSLDELISPSVDGRRLPTTLLQVAALLPLMLVPALAGAPAATAASKAAGPPNIAAESPADAVVRQVKTKAAAAQAWAMEDSTHSGIPNYGYVVIAAMLYVACSSLMQRSFGGRGQPAPPPAEAPAPPAKGATAPPPAKAPPAPAAVQPAAAVPYWATPAGTPAATPAPKPVPAPVPKPAPKAEPARPAEQAAAVVVAAASITVAAAASASAAAAPVRAAADAVARTAAHVADDAVSAEPEAGTPGWYAGFRGLLSYQAGANWSLTDFLHVYPPTLLTARLPSPGPLIASFHHSRGVVTPSSGTGCASTTRS
ncbi:hypothetical protein FOA52_012935 [Chlamydomonas sp. UWO 241]|nr:hypothetical protein FOA52_012935 [Chlamydomonas sp. UWO 241]